MVHSFLKVEDWKSGNYVNSFEYRGKEGTFDFDWELDTIWFGTSIIFLMKSSVTNEHIDFQGVLL